MTPTQEKKKSEIRKLVCQFILVCITGALLGLLVCGAKKAYAQTPATSTVVLIDGKVCSVFTSGNITTINCR